MKWGSEQMSDGWCAVFLAQETQRGDIPNDVN